MMFLRSWPCIPGSCTRLCPTRKLLEARNGLQALSMMENTRPDLVLLDLMMPEMDGFGVLEEMRSREITP